MHLKSWRIDMTREDAKQLLPIIQAFSEGKCIQTKTGSGWVNMENIFFTRKPKAYRIKPESKYRPFENAEECWQEMLKHQPFAWVKEKHSDRYSLITEVNRLSIKVKEGCLFTDSVKYYTFADGTPFGIKVEE